uniref:Transmembrane protein n=1 Tax=Pithovirus LCPAC001 TaxID=2506585 RepID=A0A481Z2E8_9VIRU|nr:MAG: hypothetical protein LCPAC001_01250 [Pithovirus LCPAC001]
MYIITYVEDNFLIDTILKNMGFITINDWLFYCILIIVFILSIKGIVSFCVCSKKRKTKIVVHNGGIPIDSITGDEVINLNTDN